MVEDDSLRCLDRRCRCGAELALDLAQQRPRLAEVHSHDGLQVGHGRERVGAEEGYTLMNEDLCRNSQYWKLTQGFSTWLYWCGMDASARGG